MDNVDNINKKTILIVEDMGMNRQLLSVILENDYQIIEAENGLEALGILEKEYRNIALIMLDIIMPVMDGFAFLERVKQIQEYKDIPIIFVTAETYKENILKGIEYGVCDVIAKPFDPYLVTNRVDQLIRLTENQKRKRAGRTELTRQKERGLVLLVDDAEMNRVILKEVLRGEFGILEAADGQEALEHLDSRGDEIAAVLLDVIMPVMDGIEMMQEARSRSLLDKIPVIAITAENSAVKMQRIKDLGICEIIHKPFDPSVIKNRVNNMIELDEM